MSTDAWRKSYKEHLDNPPKEGDILRAKDDCPARLILEIENGKPPFLYGTAFVPCIVNEPVGWFLQTVDDETIFGWKCIVMPKAREECLRRFGLDAPHIPVKALRVVRVSDSGKSLLCEIEEHYEEVPAL